MAPGFFSFQRRMMRAAELIYHELFVYMVKRDSHSAAREWEEFVELYSDPRRHYHDLDHIEEMVVLLFTHWKTNYYYEVNGIPRPREDVEREKWTAILAAFYHDCYAPWEKDAEEKSASIMEKQIDSWVSYDHGGRTPIFNVMQDAANAIRATANHESDNYIAQLVIDADLARFSTGPWRRWAGQIREEYAMHPDDKYNEGRKAVLEKFLYRTPFYYHIGNDQLAQDNIVAQLRALRQETNISSPAPE